MKPNKACFGACAVHYPPPHFMSQGIRIRAVLGFTLIEVLIVMTLLSVMVVLLFGTIKISADSWEKGEARISDVNEIAVVYSFFQRHLIPAKPLWNDFSTTEERVFSFQGNAQTLQFVSEFPASAGRAGLQWFFLNLNDFDRQSIEIAIKPFYPVAEGETFPEEKITLLNHVKTFSIAYLGQDPGTGEVAWQEQWVDRQTLPQLVKINITLDNGMFWPTMIMPLKITSEEESLENVQVVNEESDGKTDPDEENNAAQ